MPKVQKKKPLIKDKSGEDLAKSLKNVTLGDKKKTSQNSESKPLMKRSLRLRKLDLSKSKDLNKKILKKKKPVSKEAENVSTEDVSNKDAKEGGKKVVW